MNRMQILSGIKDYFKIQELVCPHVHAKYGEQAWRFFDTEFLHTLFVVRHDILRRPMVCNNYHEGGGFSQRGLRCNLCQIVRDYTNKNQVSTLPHVVGAGGDFSIAGMTAQQARTAIAASAAALPCPIRMEDEVTWLHLDTLDTMTGRKVTLFKP